MLAEEMAAGRDQRRAGLRDLLGAQRRPAAAGRAFLLKAVHTVYVAGSAVRYNPSLLDIAILCEI
jgi:hypothetical protein